MKKIPKTYIFIALILIAYVIGIFFFKKGEKEKDHNVVYVLAGINTRLLYQDQEWHTMASQTEEYKWKEFKLYNSGVYEGTYKIQNQLGVDSYYDNDYVPIGKMDVGYMAISSPGKFDYVGTSDLTINKEDANLMQVMQENNITNFDSILNSKIIVTDLNSDEEDDKLYYISNLFTGSEDQYFSIVFAVIDGKIQYIKKHINREVNHDDDVEQYVSIPDSYLNGVLKIGNNQYPKIFIENSYYGRAETCFEIYEYKKRKFENIRKCEEDET